MSGTPPRLDHDALVAAQRATLAAPKRRYSLAATVLFAGMDVLYGRNLLILEERIARSGSHESKLKFFWLPQVIAYGYYQWSWILYVLRPAWSHRLNADFEDHAEREYMQLVAEHPEWENEPFESVFCLDYGQYDSLADVFRQIGHDERFHKQESLDLIHQARFR